jgi:hypothetical protein
MSKIQLLLDCGVFYNWTAVNGELTWLDDRPIPTDEELQNLVSFNKLRISRDQLLKDTDWWVLPDRTPTQAQLDYRQALRDLPATASPALDENGNLTGVTWPTKPE